MKIYLSHAFGGEIANVNRLTGELEDFVAAYKELLKGYRVLFLSPLHALGMFYDIVDYQHGMQMCFDLLEGCDLMLTFNGYDSSRGVLMELGYAAGSGIPVMSWEEFCKDPMNTLHKLDKTHEKV